MAVAKMMVQMEAYLFVEIRCPRQVRDGRVDTASEILKNHLVGSRLLSRLDRRGRGRLEGVCDGPEHVVATGGWATGRQATGDVIGDRVVAIWMEL